MPSDAETERILERLQQLAAGWAHRHGEFVLSDRLARWWLPTESDLGRMFLAELAEEHKGDADAIHAEIGRAARVLLLVAVLVAERDELPFRHPGDPEGPSPRRDRG